MLVGRASERRAINALLAGARVGDSGVLVLCGEPGIGKTALLEDAETLVESMRVLRAQGIESERAVPFAGLLQLLRPLLPLLDQIPAPQSKALASALLLEPGGTAEPSRFAVGAATLSLLCRAAEDRPLAVLVDDAHQLDTPSAEALVFAARRLVSDAIAMVFSVRPEGETPAPWAVLRTITLDGLDLEAAQILVTGLRGSTVGGDQIARLHHATAGNPLALLELSARVDEIEALPPDSPLALSDELGRSFMRRVAGLDVEAAAALLIAAADGTSMSTISLACAELGVAPTRLAEAEDAGLISIRGDRVEFRHPLVRSAIYGSADPQQRRTVHRAFAAVVPVTETDRLAWHLSESATAPDEATAATLEQVAERASRRGAYAIAANAHERAAQLSEAGPGPARRLAAAAEAAWLAGLTDRAVTLLDQALAARPEPLLRAHIQELRGAMETRCGSLDAGLATLMEAARAVEAVSPDTAIRLYADAIHVCVYLADPTSALRASHSIERLLGDSTDPHTVSLGSMASGMALILSGSGEPGIGRVRVSAPLLAASHEGSADRFRLPLRLQGALWLRSSGPHRAVIGEAIDRMREQVALGSLPYLLMHIGRDGATTDRWDDAEAAYLEAIRLAAETGQSTDLAISLAGIACLYARQGRAAECRENIAAADDLCRTNRIGLGSLWLAFAQGDLAAGGGDPARAVGHYERLLSTLDASALGDPDLSPAPELAEALFHVGRGEDAHGVTAEFVVKAEAKGEPWSLARAHRALGLCAQGSDGEARFRAALELHATTPDRFETARTELAFGARLRRERRRQDARPLLHSALDTFEMLGAVPWANRAAQELQATGETVHRRQTDTIDELTPQERQIARLLAQGRTTREAAAALFISPKTVEYHLRHVYLKLDIRSRAALTEVFGERPAGPPSPGVTLS